LRKDEEMEDEELKNKKSFTSSIGVNGRDME
jgi:hypothetical protein